MEEANIEELERLAKRDPANLRNLERLDAARRAKGWTLHARRLEDWIEDLREGDRRRWGADDPEEILAEAGLMAIPRVIQAFWEDTAARRAAARVLGRMGPRTAGYMELVRGLRSSSASIRAAAAEGLGGCRSEAPVPLLAELLCDPEEAVRKSAVDALDDLGTMARASVPSLLRCLAEDDLGLSAAFALGYLGREDPAVVRDLVEALDCGLPWGRPWALLGLGLTRSRCALPAVLAALRDPNEEVRSRAAEALGEIGLAEKPVLEALRDALEDWDPWVRVHAAVALVGLGEDSLAVFSALAEAVGEGICRLPAIRALEKMGPRARTVLPALLALAEEGRDSERARLLSALAAIGPPAHVLPVLLPGLEDASPEVRAGAARALGSIASLPKPPIGALVRALEDPDRRVEFWAASTLRSLRPRDLPTRRSLIELAGRSDSGMRLIAVRILGAIGEDLDALLAAAEDEFEPVRFAATYWIAEIREKSERCARCLSKALQDASARVRREGAWGLGELGSMAAPAMELLIEMLLGDKDGSDREHAAYALGEIGSPAPAVVEVLSRALGDARRNVSIMAARSLWILGVEREAAHARILESLRGEDDLRNYALRIVQQAGIPASDPLGAGEVGGG